MQVPNSSGLPPGQVVEVYSFDHDLEQFVSGGTARVSEDGSVIVSDSGFGLRASGWHAAPPPPPPPTCVNGCDDKNECTSDSCVKGACQHTPVGDGTACKSDRDACTTDVCKGADPRLALRASGGALIAVMHAVLLGELGKGADCEHAEGVLRRQGCFQYQ